MKTHLSTLSLNVVRKMADAAEVEARKLGANVGIALVAADASVFFTRSMDNIDGLLVRELMKQAQNSLVNGALQNVELIMNEQGALAALAVAGADVVINKQCVQAALSVIEA